jgi:SWI/SNF-related matrix-associated actin-dependent regulator 1 of chromatin subfamily A
LKLISSTIFIYFFFQKTGEDGENKTSFEQAQIERAKKIMKPFFLRRLKKDVLSFLPKKTEHVYKVEMLDSQREKYLALVENYKTEARSSMQVSGIGIMSDMRKLANHPLLLRYYFTDEDVKGMAKKLAKDRDWKGSKIPSEVFQDIAYLSDFKLYELRDKYIVSIRH